MSSTAYETDYNQWLKETVKHLQERNFEQVDWDNLIEEIESMGKSDRRALMSLLTRLIEHLLKLAYWQEEKKRSGNHWAAAIVNFRAQIQQRLEDSPSLRPELAAMYDKVYPVAIKSVSQLFSLNSDAHISLEQTLDDNWFPPAEK
ncbi:Similar to tr/P73698/P73698 [Microcystis aeruginosa PCC 9432]|jgi:hypothetical protein|uniref:Uncharacterized protein n=11 Tax=Microcystis TaxID=1125 RepID=A0A2H6BP42_MICAE|nr:MULTISPECIES: DUF29 domain-containing protein [Microcystis]NCR99014.1 DUF29 domain-containing protein [Microcystis aeruginosa L311-01]OCY15654.1 MAG: hypothetical protein BEV12_14035 [Microcystis aeruginosa CACIAM 03]REJ60627.1 MAG: DUF29 domain-containing protein [Microcystis aeruginosa DA14]TRT94420.1 MAG: DUF29 domain-containing protein [Microcystis aeruginosa Ma_OC_LR_19540900_S633]TRU03941.1 MAG: DUF29 domain-containing protein [Microcystis aeruginosa Ma_AC_P_19900807_S300]TRU04521.1 